MRNDLKVLCKKLNYLYQKTDEYTEEGIETRFVNEEIKKIRIKILEMELDKQLKEIKNES